MVQPAEGRDGLVLWSRPGAARVELDGEVRGYSLGSTDRLTEIVALDRGWAAAGRRLVGEQARLIVVAEDRSGLRTLETPSPDGGELQIRPRLLARDGRLAGIAWLDGDSPQELDVRARSWTGAGWGPEQVVSRRAAGSQTGLTSATLADGTDLLLWAAFDGADDEIVFSRSQGDGWSAPRRVAPGNRVADVAPAVAATRGGALAAWSRFDGDQYELVLARYRRGRWQTPSVVASAGALFPRFVRLDGKLLLIYRSATPRGWQVLELAPNGAVRRRAGFLRTGPERPAIALEGAVGVNLRLPDRSVLRGYWDLP